MKYYIELLTPRHTTQNIETDLEKFAANYHLVLEAGYVVCVPDNPMGHLHFTISEVIETLALPVKPAQLMVHLNTFHTKKELDALLSALCEIGIRNLLIVSGDGCQRLHRLEAHELGIACPTVTSVELMQYIHREYAGQFTCGAAFNPYEPLDYELEKMERKAAAQACFIITQPLIGMDARIVSLAPFRLPVIVGAWMSKKLSLLSECTGHLFPAETLYDPMQNLRDFQGFYPDCAIYLSLLGFKTQFPQLSAPGGNKTSECRKQATLCLSPISVSCGICTRHFSIRKEQRS